jgi:hypothetical protein
MELDALKMLPTQFYHESRNRIKKLEKVDPLTSHKSIDHSSQKFHKSMLAMVNKQKRMNTINLCISKNTSPIMKSICNANLMMPGDNQ